MILRSSGFVFLAFAEILSLPFEAKARFATQSGESEGRPAHLVQQLVAAHSDRFPYEVAFRVPVIESPEVAELFATASTFQPAMTPFKDARTTDPMRVIYVGRLTGDGDGRVRVHTRSLLVGGPVDRATRAEVWDGPTLISALALGGNDGVLTRYDAMSVEEQYRLRASGRVSSEFMKAQVGYLQMVRYVTSILGASPDLEGPWPTGPGLSCIYSPSWGMAAEIDGATGELTRALLTNEHGTSTLHEYCGRLDAPIFPARHPREIRVYHLGTVALETPFAFPAVPEGDPGGLTLVDSARTLDSLGDDAFDWKTVASRVLDRPSNEYLNADESRTPGPAPLPADAKPGWSELMQIDPDNPDRMIVAGSSSTLRNATLAGGAAAILLAASLWVRRKWR